MSYQFYKILHVISVLVLFGTMNMALIANYQSKAAKIFSGISTLLVFVAGMGLMARIGISHGEGWPTWIKAKMGIWVVLAIAIPVLSKRLKCHRGWAALALNALFFIQVYFAVSKLV